jgi:phosphoribosylformimino-5-aminoimidazole carboxamide ribotide isomerase
VIVMTLAKVGSAAGPDFTRLREIKAQAGNRDVIAAGGVRDEADIRALSAIGVAAALVATSLHDGALTPGQLASLGA